MGKDLTIKILTEADNSGIVEAQKGIKSTVNAADEAKQAYDAQTASIEQMLDSIRRGEGFGDGGEVISFEQSSNEAQRLLDVLRRVPGPVGEMARQMSASEAVASTLSGRMGDIIGKAVRFVGLGSVAVSVGRLVQDQLYQWAERINAATAESNRLGETFHSNATSLLGQVASAQSLGEAQKATAAIEQERLRIQKEMETASGRDGEMLSSQLGQLDQIAATAARILSIEAQREMLFEAGRQARIDAATDQASIAERIAATEQKIIDARSRAQPTEKDAQELARLERSLVLLQARQDLEEEAQRAAKLALTSQAELNEAVRRGNIDRAENVRFSADYRAALAATAGDEKLALQIATERSNVRRREREEAVAAAETAASLAKAIAEGDGTRAEAIRRSIDRAAALEETGGDSKAADRIAAAKAEQRAAEEAAQAQREADEKATNALQQQISLERERARTREAELKIAGASEKEVAQAKLSASEKIRKLEIEIAQIRGTADQQAALHAEQRKQDILALAAAEASARAQDPIASTAGGDLIPGTNRRRGAVTSDTFEQPVGLGGSALDTFAANQSAPVGAIGGNSILPASPTSSAPASGDIAQSGAADSLKKAGQQSTQTASELEKAASELADAASQTNKATKSVVRAVDSLKTEISNMKQQIHAIANRI